MITINAEKIQEFTIFLNEMEYSAATISKYAHDISILSDYAGGQICDKMHLVGFRKYLEEKKYSIGSINSMLGAVNKFMEFCGVDWKLRYEKVQRKNFLPPEKELSKEEYMRLINIANELGKLRLAMLIQTLCALGIRVSELKAITVESLLCGEAFIQSKGKVRAILIPAPLVEKLQAYCHDRGIATGPIFITRTGKPMDRSNIWKMIKRLGELAKVAAKKVFPHNLRHLFVRTYYQMFGDALRLADILGHSSIDTTRIYTAHSGREERRQIAQLGLLL